jgi:pyruvate dehydrogenase E2 component (dihydrolipoamide acetyltransferase)
MAIEIIVPRLGWSMEEGAFVAWLKKDGELVRAGDALFSIEGDKAVQEIESLDSGVLRIASHAPKPGEPVRVGDVLGYLLTAEEAKGGPEKKIAIVQMPAPADEKLGAVSAEHESRDLSGAVSPAETTPRRTAGATPAISPRALRVAIELGVDWTRIKGTGRNGRIRERDIRGATGKA